MTSFKYLGHLLTETDDDWTAVIINLQTAQNIWAQLSRILDREGEDLRTSGHLYLAVVQAIMLFGAETWVITLRIGRLLGSFHHGESRKMAGMKIWRRMYRFCAYPQLEYAMWLVGFEDMESYISRRHNVFLRYIATQPILNFCLEVERRPGSRVPKRWWEQSGLDFTVTNKYFFFKPIFRKLSFP